MSFLNAKQHHDNPTRVKGTSALKSALNVNKWAKRFSLAGACLILASCFPESKTNLFNRVDEQISGLDFNPEPKPCTVLFCKTDSKTNPRQLRYKYYGANPGINSKVEGEKTPERYGTWFRVFAPGAKGITLQLMGNEEGLSTARNDGLDKGVTQELTMVKDTEGDSGEWAVFAAGIFAGESYRLKITRGDGGVEFRADPYARYIVDNGFSDKLIDGELTEDAWTWKSKVWDPSQYKWDINGEFNRENFDLTQLRIFEFHAQTVIPRKWGEDMPGWMQIAEHVVALAKKHSYNAVSIMPVSHHNLAESWGYQVNGFFGVNYRHGNPDQFKDFVNHLHKNNIAVILDLVHSHLGSDKDTGIRDFDGGDYEVYLQDDDNMKQMREWGTYLFDYNKQEARNFLLSNAVYWIDEYRLDGFRLDAVESMYSLDYGRDDNWIPVPGTSSYDKFKESNGDRRVLDGYSRINRPAVTYMREMTKLTKDFTAWQKQQQLKVNPMPFVNIAEVVTINATSSDYDSLDDFSRNSEAMGFDYKWRMGGQHHFRTFAQKFPRDDKGKLGYIFDVGRQWGGEWVNYLNSHDEVRYVANYEYVKHVVKSELTGLETMEPNYDWIAGPKQHIKRYISGLGGDYYVSRKVAEDKEHDRLWSAFTDFYKKNTVEMAASSAKPGEENYPYYNPFQGQGEMGLVNMDYTFINGKKADHNNPEHLPQMIDWAFSMHRNFDAMIHLVYPGVNMGFMGSEVAATGRWEDMQVDPSHTATFDEGPRHDTYGVFMKDLGDLFLGDAVFSQTSNDSLQLVLMDETVQEGKYNRILVSARLEKEQGKDGKKKPKILIVQNFMDHKYESYMIPLAGKGLAWELIMNSDDEKYGGAGVPVSFGSEEKSTKKITPKMAIPWSFEENLLARKNRDGNYSLVNSELPVSTTGGVQVNNLPPFSTLVFKAVVASAEELPAKKD